LIFYCGNYSSASSRNISIDSEEKQKKDLLDFLVIKNGLVEKNETLAFLSKNFVANMLNEFNLTFYLEKKYLGIYTIF